MRGPGTSDRQGTLWQALREGAPLSTADGRCVSPTLLCSRDTSPGFPRRQACGTECDAPVSITLDTKTVIIYSASGGIAHGPTCGSDSSRQSHQTAAAGGGLESTSPGDPLWSHAPSDQ